MKCTDRSAKSCRIAIIHNAAVWSVSSIGNQVSALRLFYPQNAADGVVLMPAR
jgi:hypothetical protein